MKHSRQRQNVILAALVAVSTTYTLMQTTMIPAIPSLASEFDTSTAWATWVATGFLLVAGTATPIFGTLGDQFGRRRVMIVVLAIFLAGTIGAAASWNIASLIAFRAVQGVSSAVLPLSFAIIRDEFPAERVTPAVGTVTAAFGIGSCVGVISGGFIIDHMSWRFLFLVPAVVIAIGIWLVVRVVPETPRRERTRVDVVGASLLAGSLVALLLAITEGAQLGLDSPVVLGLLVAALVLAALWIRFELATPAPMIDVRLMVRRPLVGATVISVAASFANFGTFILIPAFAETPRHVPPGQRHLVDYGLGVSSTTAGLLLLPLAVAMLIGGPLAAHLGRRTGMRWTLAGGLATLALANLLVVFRHESLPEFLVIMALVGAAFGLIYASLMTIAIESASASQVGVVLGLVATMRTIGAQLGAQAVAAILTVGVIAGTEVPRESAFEFAFALMGTVALLASLAAVFLVPMRRSRRRELPVGEPALLYDANIPRT